MRRIYCEEVYFHIAVIKPDFEGQDIFYWLNYFIAKLKEMYSIAVFTFIIRTQSLCETQSGFKCYLHSF